MITQFDDLEECEDLEYVEEKLVKTQKHCDSIHKSMQKIMKMLDKMNESIEEIGKRTLKRSVRRDSVEKGNPDPNPYPNPDPSPNPRSDPSPDPNPRSNPSPDPYPKINPKPDPDSTLDPYPKWNPKSVPNLNMKLDSSSESEIAMDVEAIEEAYSDNEGDEEREGESTIKIDRDLEEEIEVVGIHLEPLLPLSPSSLPPPSPGPSLSPFPPLQRDPPLNHTKAKIRISWNSIRPNLLNLFWPWPIQVGTTWPKFRKYFNGSANSTPDFTIWATTQGVWLGNDRGKLPIPPPPPPLPIPPRPPPGAIEVYREWFQRKFQIPFCSRTGEILCEASVNVYGAIHLFNEKDEQQFNREGIVRFVILFLYPQFSISMTGSSIGSLWNVLREDIILSRFPVEVILPRYGEQLQPRKKDHGVTFLPLGGFLGSPTFVPTTKFLGTRTFDTIQTETNMSDRIGSLLTVPIYIEEARQKLKVEPDLKENGRFMTDQSEISKAGVVTDFESNLLLKCQGVEEDLIRSKLIFLSPLLHASLGEIVRNNFVNDQIHVAMTKVRMKSTVGLSKRMKLMVNKGEIEVSMKNKYQNYAWSSKKVGISPGVYVEVVQDEQVSLNYLVGLSTPERLKLEGVERQKLVVLIDNGEIRKSIGNKRVSRWESEKSFGSINEEKAPENGLEHQMDRFFGRNWISTVWLQKESKRGKYWKLIDYFAGPKQFMLFFFRDLTQEEKDSW